MIIDPVSEHIITIALLLEKISPGTAAEIWLDADLKQSLQKKADAIKTPETLIDTTKLLIADLKDEQRKQYLTEILNSLLYQLNPSNRNNSYADFSQQSFGFKIDRVTEEEIRGIEAKIETHEHRLGKTRQQVYKKNHVEKDGLLPCLAKHIETITGQLPSYLFNYPDEGVSLNMTAGKPWGAFNSHTKPYQSVVTLNADAGLTNLDLRRLACHEVCGGHHTELSNKDQMLTVLNRGEHGIVITFSPQTFISEALAEAMYDLLGVLDKTDDEMMLDWYYHRLIFALQNKATYLFFDDGVNREEIDKKLSPYAVSKQTRTNILNFSCDPLFGRYAPVYYSAYLFLADLYQKTPHKEKLVKALFSQPCTPTLLTQEFS